MNNLSQKFLIRLKEIIPGENYQRVLNTFSFNRCICIRVNTLKTSKERIINIFKDKQIEYSEVSGFKDVLILDNYYKKGKFNKIGYPAWFSILLSKGEIYIQSLSSILVPHILNPQPGENVLDMCAAPGSKTSQMSAMMENRGSITCLEVIKSRFYKLKNVLSVLGVNNAKIILIDARRFKPKEELFDEILLDAPCSSEGRFNLNNPKTYRYWSVRKIKEMQKKQRGLILNASRCLKPGGVLVYSTCTFSPEENESVIDWAIKKTGGALMTEKIFLKNIKTYPPLDKWGGKEYNKQVKNCIRILPDEKMEGFFITKMIKN